jgi:hypothetical protein
MTREDCAELLCNYIKTHPSNFNAAYGVYTITHTDEKRNKFVAVNFGRPDTLEARLWVYGPEFIWCNSNQGHWHTVDSIDAAKECVDRL